MAQEQPRPMVFAVMRNTHEAFRMAMKEMNESLSDKAQFESKWNPFKQALKVHMALEENTMFPILNASNSNVTTPLSVEHDDDAKQISAVDDALAAGGGAGLQAAYATWHEAHLKHLTHEEDIMMPLLPKLVEAPPTPKKLGAVMHKILANESMEHLNFLVKYTVGLLTRHGSTTNDAATATRVFVWGLQYSSSDEQWAVWSPIIKQATTEAIWNEMVDKFKVDEMPSTL
jgi:hypothetical protein